MDPVTTTALIGAGTQLFSAFGAKSGQDRANRQQMEFNSDEAKKQREFEAAQFATRYQTTRKDLEAAGYNPILALGGQPNSPSGAVASASPRSSTADSSNITAHSAQAVADLLLTREGANLTAEKAKTEKSQQNLNDAMASGRIGFPGFGSVPLSTVGKAADAAKKAGPAALGGKIANWVRT